LTEFGGDPNHRLLLQGNIKLRFGNFCSVGFVKETYFQKSNIFSFLGLIFTAQETNEEGTYSAYNILASNVLAYLIAVGNSFVGLKIAYRSNRYIHSLINVMSKN